MTRNLVCHASYLRNHTSYVVIFGTHVYYNISWCFFHFFKILVFWFVRGVKGQKMVQSDKKFCLLHLISQEPYIIWLSFMVHICKMIISVGLSFWFRREVKGQRTVQNDKKFCLSNSLSQEPYIIWLWFLVHMCKMMI